MKKNLLGWLAMATMLVGTGCSSDEVVNDYSPENAIQFGTYVGRDAQGRASVIDDTNLGTLGFGVYAYYTDGASFNESSSTPNFMRNQKVEKTIDGWVYDPLKYWPNESTDKLSFFAYAPYQGTGDAENNLTLSQITNGGIPKVVFSLNQDVEKQEDLLWAIPHLNVQKQNVNSDIKFALKDRKSTRLNSSHR